MIKNSMISWVAVAMLLISIASLSSASCTWFLRGELYSAQCGITKEVPASHGILANDPQAVAVLNPESITIDPKYGSIEVEADGSFIYYPSPNIPQGTYVQFKYNATNGVCQAKYPASAKLIIRCTCRPNIVSVDPIPLPVSLAEIRSILEEAGVGCIGCGDITTIIDLSDIDLDSNGAPIAGTYSFCIKCPGCQVACGQITLVDSCGCEVEDFAFCEGTVTLNELMAMAEEKARCVGCDLQPVLDFSGVTVDKEGYVTGGSYVGTCEDDPQSGGSDIGYITVWKSCDAFAPPLEICEGSSHTDLVDAITALDPGCTGSGCDATAVISYDNVLYDEDGKVIGGTYTVTCITSNGCESTADGAIEVVERCSCNLIALTVGCVSPEDLEAQIMAENPAPCVDCDTTPIYQFPDWPTENGLVLPGSYEYLVRCQDAGGVVGCDSECVGVVIVDCQTTCTCEVENFAFCEGTITLDELMAIAQESAFCVGCDLQPVLDFDGVTVDDQGFVTGGSYTGTCGDINHSGSTNTGYINVWPRCDVIAPAVEICEGSSHTDLEDAITALDPGCTGSGCDATAVISYENVLYDEDGKVIGGTYTVTCITSNGCESTADGAIEVVERCSCNLIALTVGCVSPEDLEAQIMAENPAPCVDCDTTPIYQFPDWPTENGLVLPGSYEYLVRCQDAGGVVGCDSECVGVVIVDCQTTCTCEVENFAFCEGTITLDELMAIAQESAFCVGCDLQPVLDFDGVTVDDQGFVTGGSYTGTCGDINHSGSTDTGYITVWSQCDVAAPAVEICEGSSHTDLEDAITALDPGCTGSGCDATAVISYEDVLYGEGGKVIGGTYTVTCINSNGCESTAEGSIEVVERCSCDLIGLTAGCASPEDLEAQIMEENSFPCGDCDATPVYDFPDWPTANGLVLPGFYEYTVYCQGAGGLEGCDSECQGELIVDCQPVCPCEAVAPDIPICPNEVTLEELVMMISDVAECGSILGLPGTCDVMPEIDTSGVIIEGGYVVPDSSFYKVTCRQDDLCGDVEATGRVIMGTDCDDGECTAPCICLPIVCANGKCRDYSTDYYMHYVISAIEEKISECSCDCNVLTVIVPNNIKWDEPSLFEYTMICESKGVTKTATGLFQLDWTCGCGPCGC